MKLSATVRLVVLCWKILRELKLLREAAQSIAESQRELVRLSSPPTKTGKGKMAEVFRPSIENLNDHFRYGGDYEDSEEHGPLP